MKKSKLLRVVATLLVMILAFAGCSAPGENSDQSSEGNASGETYEFTLGHSGSTDHHYQISAEKFAEIISEKTDGAIKINIFPSSQLGAGPDQLESVMIGTQDMVITPDAFLANHDPLFNVMGMPYQITSFDQVKKFPESEIAAALEEKAKENEIVVLGWMANGFRLVTSNAPIESPDDMEGLKMRIGSAKLISTLRLSPCLRHILLCRQELLTDRKTQQQTF